jgi:membrane-bound lytic murein transglycosylase F
MMRRLSGLAAACAALLAAAVPAAADLPEIQKRGVLRVLVMPDVKRPEFFSLDPAAPPGLDHEILAQFARLHRLELKPVPVSGWGELVPALREGRGDLVAGRFTATDARRKLVAFTTEVFPTRNVMITRKPHRVVRTVEELRSERVGTSKGSSMAEAIAAAGVPPSNVDDTLAPGTFGEALKAGRVTASVWGVESAIALQREDPDIQLGAFLGPPASLAYAVRKGDTKLLAALDEYLTNLRRSPTWNRLVVKYFGEAAPEVLKKGRSE